jgi:phosphotransacetylase
LEHAVFFGITFKFKEFCISNLIFPRSHKIESKSIDLCYVFVETEVVILAQIESFTHMKRIADLFDYIRSHEKKTLVAVNAVDGHSLEAIAEAVQLGIISAVITGNKVDILAQCSISGIDHQLFQIIHAESLDEAAKLAIQKVQQVPGSILMKGLIGSDQFMKAILNKELGLFLPGSVLSHVSVIDNPNYHKLLIVSDVAIIPYPTIPQKIAMIHYLTQMAMVLGILRPKIALITPTEKVLASLVSTTDAAEIMVAAENGQFEPAVVFGPMALDVAIDLESAQIKNINSEVAGDADCLLFPNIDAGNVFYKTNTKLCHAEQAAVVMGANVPVVLSSRGDSKQTKLNSIVLAALLSK